MFFHAVALFNQEALLELIGAKCREKLRGSNMVTSSALNAIGIAVRHKATQMVRALQHIAKHRTVKVRVS